MKTPLLAGSPWLFLRLRTTLQLITTSFYWERITTISFPPQQQEQPVHLNYPWTIFRSCFFTAQRFNAKRIVQHLSEQQNDDEDEVDTESQFNAFDIIDDLFETASSYGNAWSASSLSCKRNFDAVSTMSPVPSSIMSESSSRYNHEVVNGKHVEACPLLREKLGSSSKTSMSIADLRAVSSMASLCSQLSRHKGETEDGPRREQHFTYVLKLSLKGWFFFASRNLNARAALQFQ